MESVNERIAFLIKDMGISRSTFADRLHISRPFASELCSGAKQPSDRTIADICREFNVNETWLRTGEGEMFNALSRDEQIAYRLGAMLAGQGDTIQKRLIAALSDLDESEWSAVEAFARKLVEQSRDAPPNKESG